MAFDPEESERFAALMAGFEIGNTNEAEAMGKGRVMRRMLVEKNIRLVDAMELPEIRAALDRQLQPVRQGDVTAMHAELEDLRGKLAVVVPRATELADALTNERRELVGFVGWLIIVAIICALFAAAFGKTGYVAGVVVCSLFPLFCRE